MLAVSVWRFFFFFFFFFLVVVVIWIYVCLQSIYLICTNFMHVSQSLRLCVWVRVYAWGVFFYLKRFSIRHHEFCVHCVLYNICGCTQVYLSLYLRYAHNRSRDSCTSTHRTETHAKQQQERKIERRRKKFETNCSTSIYYIGAHRRDILY